MAEEFKTLVAHPGTQYAPRLAAELHRHGALARFVTGLGFAEDGRLGQLERLAPSSWRRRWANRRIAGVPPVKLATYPALEFAALRRIRRGEPSEQVFFERNATFQRAIPDRWIEAATHVVGFDTSSWILAERCRRLGRPFVLDQSIGHPRAKESIYRELRSRFPDWAETVPEKNREHLATEQAEHELAAAVVVPSHFVHRTLVEQGVPAEKIHVIPFGTDLDLFAPAESPAPGPVTFLFAGSLTARKGLPVLLQAWSEAQLASRARLWLAGPGSLPAGAVLPDRAQVLGALARTDLAGAMRRAHCFVCPSFFEGLAQVQVEALALGLPVIGTPASGAEEIVIPGENGFIVPTGEVGALAEVMRRIADDTALRGHLRAGALARRGGLAWRYYGDRWRQLLAKSLSNLAALQPVSG